MKILITTDLFTTETNGVVTSVKNLYEAMKARGHDVRILTISESTHSHNDGDVYYIRSVSLEAVYPNVRMPVSYHHRLIKELIEWHPDVIHSQCELFSFRFAMHVSKLTGAPIVHTYHTMYEQYVTYVIPAERLGKFIVKIMSRSTLNKVEHVVVPTEKVEEVLHNYGIERNISVVPSGISLEQHMKRLTAEERAAKRAELGIDENSIVLVNLGRLGEEKNVHELLRYFARALEENESLAFLIVGDGPARPVLEKLCEELKIKDKVVFTGMVEPLKVYQYYQTGDIFVSASTSETQGLTYIEAAANGLPLLCRKDPCLEGVIKNSENGFEYTDEDEFISALRFMASNEKWRKNAALESEKTARAYGKEAFAEAIEKIYVSVLQKDHIGGQYS
ncbi:MAG: glycosyltransferase family 4 protein [Ruminococcaceae bacterium]|nr:glycosyltransferase family 4 protein [Oscillospiraceae bacterium]